MGQARIRRLLGLPPREQPHRFPEAGDDTSLPGGCMMVWMHLAGFAPISSIIDAAEAFAAVEALAAQITRDPVPYDALAAAVARDLRRAIQRRRDQEMPALARQSLYLALYHPQFGEQMRDGLSLAIRRGGAPHITIFLGDALGLRLDGGFVDMTAAVAAVPEGEQAIDVHDDGADVPLN